MKAIIMAAGKGTRIKEFIDNIPKCTVKIDKTPLIVNTINVLMRHKITDITIVVGYEYEQVLNALHDYKFIRFINNTEYEKTNGIYSIWMASNSIEFNDDILLMSGDLYITDRIVEVLIHSKKDPVLLTDSSRIKQADFRFAFKDDILLKYGKDLSISETNGECLGIGKMSSNFAKTYKEHLDFMIKNGIVNLWWESVFYDLIGKMNIYVEDVNGEFWGEIDTYDDYLRIQKHIKNETR